MKNKSSRDDDEAEYGQQIERRQRYFDAVMRSLVGTYKPDASLDFARAYGDAWRFAFAAPLRLIPSVDVIRYPAQVARLG